MSRLILFCCFAFVPTFAWAAPPRRAELPEGVGMLVHVDFEAIQKHPFGRELIASVLEQPGVAKQLQGLPEPLKFIKTIQFLDLTVVELNETSDDIDVQPVVLARLKFDKAKTMAFVKQGRDYATVSYHGIEVHHWQANLDALADVVLERTRTKDEKEEVEFKSMYLAFPEPGAIVFSTSLRQLTKVLDRRANRTAMMKEERFTQWVGKSENLLYASWEDAEDDFPSNVVARLAIDEHERISLFAETVCRSEREQHFGKMVANVVNNYEQYSGMVQAFFGIGDEAKEDEKEATDESKAVAEVDSKDSKKKREGRFTFGVSVDNKGEKRKESLQANWFAEFAKFITRVVEADYKDDVLRVTALAYPEKWEVDLKSKDNVDEISIQLHLNSTSNAAVASSKEKATRR